MKKKLDITIVQSQIFWQQPGKNLQALEQKLDKVQSGLILLPEMFNTGFNIDPRGLAENFDGPTVRWMKNMASRLNSAIAGSIIFEENGKFYNRLIFVSPAGKMAYYDKRHSFSMAGENKFFTKGNKNVIINYQGWRIKPLICYDLRFPVWARNKEEYDLLLYVANWPHSRIEQWEIMVRSRAIENQCYTVAVNRVGEDGNGFYYSGLSLAVSPKGEILYKAPLHREDLGKVTLDLEELQKAREKFPVLKDRDNFEIENEEVTVFDV